jgi:hypothetical protein
MKGLIVDDITISISRGGGSGRDLLLNRGTTARRDWWLERPQSKYLSQNHTKEKSRARALQLRIPLSRPTWTDPANANANANGGLAENGAL